MGNGRRCVGELGHGVCDAGIGRNDSIVAWILKNNKKD